MNLVAIFLYLVAGRVVEYVAQQIEDDPALRFVDGGSPTCVATIRGGVNR